MARNVVERLFDPVIIENGLRNYTLTTGDYNLVDRMDMVPFAPTFNAATSTVDVFCDPKSRRISFRIVDLFPDCEIGAILADFSTTGITHGYVFHDYSKAQRIFLFYLQALKLLPPNIAAQIVFWKRAAYAAEENMLAGRKQVWDDLWHNDFAAIFCFHPALFATMTLYKGPIPLFLQTVHAWLAIELGPKAIETIYSDIVCRDWTISPSTPRFLSLWHRIMKESAVVYLPSKDDQTLNHTSKLKSSHVGIAPSLQNSDKLLCLLLLLFHDTYRTALAAIQFEEAQPAILADLFGRYPLLQPK